MGILIDKNYAALRGLKKSEELDIMFENLQDKIQILIKTRRRTCEKLVQ